MSKEQNITSFTAADIERYHQGLMSSKERHALEKAALEDPFLADALEGYANATLNVSEDIAQLKKRIDNRTEKTKITPARPGRTSSFVWWKVAAMVVLVVGAGLLVYQLAFKNRPAEIAQTHKDVSNIAKTTDSVSIPSAGNTDSIVKYDVTGTSE